MFNSFPRECGPPRQLMRNMKEFLDYVNIYNGKKKAVYTSIYTFQQVNENNKPNYDTAEIDKIFFDFDDKSCESWKECNVLHEHLLKENIKHVIVMSGRGYHLYIFTHPIYSKIPKHCIYNSQHHFISLLNLTVDAQVIGNPAQLARVPNTFNVKGMRFCIPLTKEQFEMGDEYIKQLAFKQNFIKNIMIGNQLLDIKKFDYKINNIEDYEINDKEFEDSSNVNYEETSPPCIRLLLLKNNLRWKERYLIILYYRELGYTRKEIYNILKKCLSEKKLHHCITEERQLQYLFERHDLTFPKCEKLMEERICPKKCEKFNKIIYQNI